MASIRLKAATKSAGSFGWPTPRLAGRKNGLRTQGKVSLRATLSGSSSMEKAAKRGEGRPALARTSRIWSLFRAAATAPTGVWGGPAAAAPAGGRGRPPGRPPKPLCGLEERAGPVRGGRHEEQDAIHLNWSLSDRANPAGGRLEWGDHSSEMISLGTPILTTPSRERFSFPKYHQGSQGCNAGPSLRDGPLEGLAASSGRIEARTSPCSQISCVKS